MQDVAPPLSEAEREAYISRCPDGVRRLFRGWLEGTHHLDGDPVEVPNSGRRERVGVFIGHRLGAALLFFAPSLRPGVEWTKR